MQIFTFRVSDRIRTHGKYKINLEVAVVLNNVQTMRKQLVSALEIFINKEDTAIRNCKYLTKASYHRQKNQIEIESTEFLDFLHLVRNKTEDAFYEDRAVYCEHFSSIIDTLQQGMETMSFLNLEANFNKFSEWIKVSLARKIDMCEKLQALNNKPLNAVISFLENGYESQFTKYHLNLEHFADLMHKILQVEFNEQHLNYYQALEKEHFEAMEAVVQFEAVSLNDYLIATDKVILNHANLDKVHPEIIKAQIRGQKILSNFQGLIGRIYKISQKFEEIHEALRVALPNQDIRKPFLQIMSLSYRMNVKEFFLKKAIDHIQNYIQLVKENAEELQNIQVDKILFSNLEKIEPEYARKLKQKVLQTLRESEGCSISDFEAQYMIKKNGKGIFDRNSFYTHTLICYEFVPKVVSDLKNKYTASAGYDKILIESKTARYSGKIFSVFLSQDIEYDIFIQLNYYHINISNHYHSKAA